ncbi:MAG TPA: MFS transporter [Nocardioidaceae bacterium]|nr:MFS transporter [Nocardioidaceae bacterium]
MPRFSNPFALLPREVAVLAAVAFAVAVGYGIVAPAIPVFASSFGVGETAAGAVISAFALMRFVSALAGGRMVERFGERVILSAGILIVAVSTGLSGLAQSYEQLLVLRGIGGVGSAMFTVSAIALLFRVVGGTSRGRATGLFQGGFLIGGLLGPAMGGVLTELSLRLPFFVYAGTLLVAGGISAVFLARARLRPSRSAADDASGPSEEKDAAEEVVEESIGIREALRHPAYRAALAANFATGWALFGVRMSLIPLFVTQGMQAGVIWVGVGFVCSSVTHAVLLLPAGKYVDQVGRRPAMVRGAAVAAVSMLLLAFTSALPLYLFAMLMFGVGSAYLGTSPGAVVGDVMRGRGGRVVAVFQMASDLGAIVGPLAAGQLVSSLSYPWAWSVTSGVLVVSLLMALRMPETLVTEEPARP